MAVEIMTVFVLKSVDYNAWPILEKLLL